MKKICGLGIIHQYLIDNKCYGLANPDLDCDCDLNNIGNWCADNYVISCFPVWMNKKGLLTTKKPKNKENA